MPPKLYIFGLSITARQLHAFLEQHKLFNIAGFVVDAEYKNCDTFLSLPVYSVDELETFIDKKKDYIFIALAWNRLNKDRRNKYEELKARNFRFANIIAPNANIRGKLQGDNIWIHDFVTVLQDAIIEENVILMPYSLIGSSTHICAHSYINVRATVAGGCTIGQQCFIGICATVFDERQVGDKCIIGACSFIKRSLKACSLVRTKIESMNIQVYDPDIIEDKLVASKNVTS